MFECLRCFYIPWMYQKLQIGTNYDCSNTRRWWGKWRNFRIFSKKPVIYTKLLLFLKKYENFSISLIIGVCLNNHNLFQFEAFGTSKVCRSISNTQTFHFFRIFLVCLFLINIRDFKPKKAFFGQIQGKNGGKQTKSKKI